MATKELTATISVICSICEGLMKPVFKSLGEGIPATAHCISVWNERQGDGRSGPAKPTTYCRHRHKICSAVAGP